jgi:energy-coupling factor transporter ATP-binding protein EcfA2
VTAMEAARLVLILGPEGCGKSSAVMRSIDRLVPETGEPVFISSPSYQQSAEKIRDFTAMYPNGPFVAFEYLSSTELYQRHCPEGARISEIDALEMGYSSWLRATTTSSPRFMPECALIAMNCTPYATGDRS